MIRRRSCSSVLARPGSSPHAGWERQRPPSLRFPAIPPTPCPGRSPISPRASIRSKSRACPTGPAVALPARGGAPRADSLVASLGELSRRLESLRTERCSPQPGVAQPAAPADTTDDLAAMRAAAAEAAAGAAPLPPLLRRTPRRRRERSSSAGSATRRPSTPRSAPPATSGSSRVMGGKPTTAWRVSSRSRSSRRSTPTPARRSS